MPAHTPGRARRRAAITLIVIAACTMVFFFWRSSSEIPPIELGVVAGSSFGKGEGSERASVVTRPESRDTLTAPEPARLIEPTIQPVHGRVVDEHFGLPLFAKITSDAGPVAFSDPLTGEFQFPLDVPDSGELHSIAEGFLEAIVDAKAAREAAGVEIRMRSARFATLIVKFADGSAARDLPVAWRSAVDIPYASDPRGWIDSRAQDRGDALETRTDAEGIARLAIASPTIAVVKDPNRGVAKTVMLAPGREVLVVLAETVLTLRFVEGGSRKPAAALEIDAWCSQEIHSMTEPLLTDSDGILKLAPTSYPVLLRRHGPRAFESYLIPISLKIARCGVAGDEDLDTMLRIDAPLAEMVTIEVWTSAPFVHVIDAVSGAAIDARARLVIRSREPPPEPRGRKSKPIPWTLSSPRANLGSVDPICLAQRGELRLPVYFRAHPADLVRGIDSKTELVVLAAGYQPYIVHEASDALSDLDGAPLYKLTPAKLRSLRLLRPDGGPYLGNIVAASLEAKVLCYSSTGNAAGIYGPFDWLGGPLAIYVNVEVQDPWMIPAPELEGHEVVTFTLPIPMGSIVVDEIPESAQCVALIARSHREVDYSPDRTEPGRCRFTAVPAGSYLVGPRDWVRGAALQAMEAGDLSPAGNLSVRVQLKAGETALVHWRDMWAAGREINGRVRVQGLGRIEPFLVPLYGSEGGESDQDASKIPLMIFARPAPRIELDRDGFYRIGPNDALPRLIAICLADSTGWGDPNGLHVLESIRPGESAEIQTGSVMLRWKGQGNFFDEGMRVRYDLPVEALRHPLNSFHKVSENRWLPPAALRLDGIPLYVKQLAIGVALQPVTIEPGKLTEIELDYATFRQLELAR